MYNVCTVELNIFAENFVNLWSERIILHLNKSAKVAIIRVFQRLQKIGLCLSHSATIKLVNNNHNYYEIGRPFFSSRGVAMTIKQDNVILRH